jgi:predicted enzyme related to lactoylglutathione lyase
MRPWGFHDSGRGGTDSIRDDRAVHDLKDRKETIMADGAFTFTKLIVGDLERSAAFYRDVCGLAEVDRISAESDGRTLTEIILAGDPPTPATLILITYHGEPVAPSGDSVLGFYTADIDAFLERLVAAGGSVTSPVKALPEAGLKYAMATDNEGHIIEPLQRT